MHLRADENDTHCTRHSETRLQVSSMRNDLLGQSDCLGIVMTFLKKKK